MKADDAQRCGIGHGLGQLDRLGALAQPLQESLDGGVRVVAEQGFSEFFRFGPCLSLPRFERFRDLSHGIAQQRHQIDRVAPRVPLLAPHRQAEGLDQRGQHPAGVLPTDPVQQLERLVHEVDDVPAVQVDVVGGRRAHQVGQLGVRHALVDGGQQAALGAFGAPHLHEIPEPALEMLPRNLLILKRRNLELGGAAGAVPGDVDQPVVHGQDPLGPLQTIADVGHGAEDGEARAPVPALADTIECSLPCDLIVGDAAVVQSHHRFAHDEAEVLLHAFLQAPAPALDRIDGGRCHVQINLSVAHLDGVGIHIVGEQIEGAAAHQVEARMVPVTGEDTVLNGPAMQGKTHVRTAVVDGVQFPVVVEDHDRDRSFGHHQGTSGSNFLK